MFDTVTGLPVHVLVVHAVVVLVPLLAMLTFLVAAVPNWRPRAPLIVAGDLAGVVAALAARQSGQALQGRLSRLSGTTVADSHGRLGSVLWIFAVLLLASAVVAWFASRTPALVPMSIVITALACVTVIGWTVVTGDSGARAVWSQTIANTKAP